MTFNIIIDQRKLKEHGLKPDAGALMYLMTQLSSWAVTKVIDGEVFYNLAYSKVVHELPYFYNNNQKVYKVLTLLKSKGLVEQAKVGTALKNYVKLTEIGKQWNRGELRLIKKDEPEPASSKKKIRLIKKDEPEKSVNTTKVQEVTVSGSSKKMTYYNISITKDIYIRFLEKKSLKNYAKEVGNYFDKETDIQLMKVYGFLLNLKNKNELEYFKKQMLFYYLYKELSGEIIHRFESFTGDWDSTSWESLYKKLLAKDVVIEPLKPYLKGAC